jgi:hypothetical protein
VGPRRSIGRRRQTQRDKVMDRVKDSLILVVDLKIEGLIFLKNNYPLGTIKRMIYLGGRKGFDK